MQNNDDNKYNIFLEDHLNNLRDIDNLLNSFLSIYKNKKKIKSLLSIFLLNYNIIFRCYGINGLIKFSQENWRDALRFGYYIEDDINLKLPKKKYHSLWILIIKYLNCFLLPGADIKSISDKITLRLSKFSILGIKPITCEKRKETLISILIQYFSKYHNDEDLLLIRNLLSNDIPKLFYSDPILTKKKLIKINCVSNIFFEFIGYENIFLYQSKITITGNQHGGGYFSYKNILFHDLEYSICDEYVGWGLSERLNKHQKKFKKISSNKSNEKRIIWHESATIPLPNFYLFFDIFKQITEKKIDYIYSELNDRNIEFINQPHPFRSKLYEKYRDKVLIDPRNRGENKLSKSDLLIFDNSATSLLHFCIENDILFIIISVRSELNCMTENQLKWYQILRDAGQWIFIDEKKKLGDLAEQYLLNQFNMNEIVKNFHKSTFIDI